MKKVTENVTKRVTGLVHVLIRSPGAWCSASQDGDLDVSFTQKPAVFGAQGFLKIRNTPNDPPELPEAFNFTSILYTLNTHP